MLREIIVCDKCRDTEEKTRNFKRLDVRLPIQYRSPTLHLCPKCFEALMFNLKDAPKHEKTPEEKLYDFIYDIVAEAMANQ